MAQVSTRPYPPSPSAVNFQILNQDGKLKSDYDFLEKVVSTIAEKRIMSFCLWVKFSLYINVPACNMCSIIFSIFFCHVSQFKIVNLVSWKRRKLLFHTDIYFCCRRYKRHFSLHLCTFSPRKRRKSCSRTNKVTMRISPLWVAALRQLMDM